MTEIRRKLQKSAENSSILDLIILLLSLSSLYNDYNNLMQPISAK